MALAVVVCRLPSQPSKVAHLLNTLVTEGDLATPLSDEGKVGVSCGSSYEVEGEWYGDNKYLDKRHGSSLALSAFVIPICSNG